MIRKSYLSATELNKAEYVLTPFGEQIVEKFFKKDISIRKDLITALLNYKMANNQLDVKTYTEFKDFRVRPFFILLKILSRFQEKFPSLPLDLDPYDLGFIVLTTKTEDEVLIERAVNLMYKFVIGTTNLEECLQQMGTNRGEFTKKTNNCITRLFRWPYYCGLIKCKSDPLGENFFDRWEPVRGFRVSTVLGISSDGQTVFNQFKDTYYYWEEKLHPSEILILEVLKSSLKDGVDKEALFSALEKRGMVNETRYTRQLERLKSFFGLREDDGRIYLSKIPVFDDLNESILKKSREIAQDIGPMASLSEIQEIEVPEISSEENRETYEFVKTNLLMSDQDIDGYANDSIDRYFLDYSLLSVGDPRLRDKYTDIRQTFETKTAKLFQQMNFRVTTFGQRARGTSSIDILAGWSRIDSETNQIMDRYTVIECKTSKFPYNISLTDVDARVRQIRNLMGSREYREVRSLISSLLFVSSSWGGGENQEKMHQIEEKVRQELRHSIKVGLISADNLLYMNSLYKKNPQKFGEFDFGKLFRTKEISTVDIERIFV